MELTRRDALAALAAIGAGGGVGSVEPAATDGRDRETERLVAVARVVYPSAVEGIETFVRTYAEGREYDPAYRDGVTETLAEFEGYVRSWYDAGFLELPSGERASVLEDTGAKTATADSEGSLAGRLRYYVVDDLLYALYASPTGGRLVGVENPPGHPGGLAPYQSPP